MPTMQIIFKSGAIIETVGLQDAIDNIVSYWLNNHDDITKTENEITPPGFDKTIVYRCVDVAGIVVLP